jgi:hypothetical protein
MEVVVTISEVRRLNAIEIMKENALDELSFAMCVGQDEVQFAALLAEGSSKKMSDSLARVMEQTFSKPKLWLDSSVNDGDGQGPSFDLFG